MKLYGLVLKGRVLLDRWGDLIASSDISQFPEWCGYKDFVANGAEVKEILVVIRWNYF